MTEMEYSCGAEIIDWALNNTGVLENLTTPELTQMFWDEYFDSCEMGAPETGLEMPHESTKSDLFG